MNFRSSWKLQSWLDHKIRQISVIVFYNDKRMCVPIIGEGMPCFITFASFAFELTQIFWFGVLNLSKSSGG